MLIEYIPYGDLLGYLRKSRGLNDTYYKDPDIKPQTSLTSQQLMKFAWQISDGMSYLSSKSVSLMIYIPIFYEDLQVFAAVIMKLSLLVSISTFVEVTKSTSWRVYVEGCISQLHSFFISTRKILAGPGDVFILAHTFS